MDLVLTLLPYVNHFYLHFHIYHLAFHMIFDPWLIHHLGIFPIFCLSFLFYQVGIKVFILRDGYDICKGFESLL